MYVFGQLVYTSDTACMGLNGANSIYAYQFCMVHHDNRFELTKPPTVKCGTNIMAFSRWDMSKPEAHYTNTAVRTLVTP